MAVWHVNKGLGLGVYNTKGSLDFTRQWLGNHGSGGL